MVGDKYSLFLDCSIFLPLNMYVFVCFLVNI